MTNITNSTADVLGRSVDLYDIFFNINEASGQWFTGLILISLFVVIMVFMMNRQNTELSDALMVAGFLTMFICMGFAILEMLPLYFVILPVIALIAGFLVKYFS